MRTIVACSARNFARGDPPAISTRVQYSRYCQPQCTPSTVRTTACGRAKAAPVPQCGATPSVHGWCTAWLPKRLEAFSCAFTGVSADAFFDAVRRLIDEFYLDQSVVHALSSLQVGRRRSCKVHVASCMLHECCAHAALVAPPQYPCRSLPCSLGSFARR